MATWNLTTTVGNAVNQTQVWSFGSNTITLEQTFDNALYAIHMMEGMTIEVPEGLIGAEDFTGDITYEMPNRVGIDISNYLGENVTNVELVGLTNLQGYNLLFSVNMTDSEKQSLQNLFSSEGVSGWANLGYSKVDEDVNLVGVLRLDLVDIGGGG